MLKFSPFTAGLVFSLLTVTTGCHSPKQLETTAPSSSVFIESASPSVSSVNNLENSLNNQIENDLQKINTNIPKYDIKNELNLPVMFLEHLDLVTIQASYKINSYNIEKTNSVTSPYKATVPYELKLYYNTRQFGTKEMTTEYVLKNNVWLIQKAELMKQTGFASHVAFEKINTINLFE